MTTSARQPSTATAAPGHALNLATDIYDSVLAILARDRLAATCVASAAELGLNEDPVAVVFVVADQLSERREELERLIAAAGEAPVVVVCGVLRPGELRMALAAGAAGLVLEVEVDVALASCLEAVRAGQICVPRRQARQVEAAALSPREKQILGLVVMGYMNGEIAARLFLAESTVKSHLSSAFGKLGVRSRSEAVDLIVDPGRGLGMGILALGGEQVTVDPGPTG